MTTKMEVPNYIPKNVKNLARALLDGIHLPETHKQVIPKDLQFSKLQQYPAEPGEVVILDICDDFPTLASLILVRDTLGDVLKSISHAAGTADAPACYLMIPFLEHTKKYLFGLVKLASLNYPSFLGTAFRVHNGRLVLVGQNLDTNSLREQIAMELAVNRAIDAGHFHMIKMDQHECPDSGCPEHLRDFMAKSGKPTLH